MTTANNVFIEIPHGNNSQFIQLPNKFRLNFPTAPLPEWAFHVGLGSHADIYSAEAHFRFAPQADICSAIINIGEVIAEETIVDWLSHGLDFRGPTVLI